MILFKTYRDLFPDLFFGNLNQQEMMLFLLMTIPWIVFQFIMLQKCRRMLLRFLPFLLALSCVLIGEIMTIHASGWDGLGWAILTNYLSYGLLGALSGMILWTILQKIKKYTAE